MVKETGCGFSESTLQQLKVLDIAAVDVSGFGGTHWGRIEGQRVSGWKAQCAESFSQWGISTVESLLNARRAKWHRELWASGGVRTGLDAAKALALGAHQVGLAQPLLKAALQGTESLVECMKKIEYELKVALFCSGSKDIPSLKKKGKLVEK